MKVRVFLTNESPVAHMDFECERWVQDNDGTLALITKQEYIATFASGKWVCIMTRNHETADL